MDIVIKVLILIFSVWLIFSICLVAGEIEFSVVEEKVKRCNSIGRCYFYGNDIAILGSEDHGGFCLVNGGSVLYTKFSVPHCELRKELSNLCLVPENSKCITNLGVVGRIVPAEYIPTQQNTKIDVNVGVNVV